VSVDLIAKATQSGFAELVGTSKQAVQKHAAKIGLKKGGTYADWLRIYCEHLRTEAAGRGGESMNDLTKQRILESEQKTLAMMLDNQEKLGALVSVEDVSTVFDEFSGSVPTAINSAAESILAAIESKYSIQLDDELVHGPIRAAADRVAGTARKLSEGIRQRS
jgi:phage terminase Nu1 subunit (DNA packaging protein)